MWFKALIIICSAYAYSVYFTLLVAAITIVQCEEEAPKKPNPLLRRAANRNTFTKTTTTTLSPIQDEYQDEIDENGEYIDGDQGIVDNNDSSAAVTTTSTTEPAKKIGPIIRPFRSNDDLLSALKRRQQNMKSIKKVTSKPYTEDQQEKEAIPVSPSKLNKSADRLAITAKKNRFGNARAPIAASEQHETPAAEEVTPQPTVKRPARSRFGFNRSN